MGTDKKSDVENGLQFRTPDDGPDKSATVRRVMKAISVLITLAVAGGLAYFFWTRLDSLTLFIGSILIGLFICLVIIKLRWFYIAMLTAPRDVTALYRFIKLLTFVKKLQRKNVSVCDMFEEQVKKHPNKACIVFENREWTFKEIDEVKNRVAGVFFRYGFKHGDKVGLLMENRPEFVAIWLGLSKLGVVTPLINHNLKKQILHHSITIANCNALIFEGALSESVQEIQADLKNVSLYQFNDTIKLPLLETAKDLQLLMRAMPNSPLPNDRVNKPGHHDELIYIYTSGTTGLPKAAVITHSRYIYITAAIMRMCDFWAKDVFYSPLPLYHTACGIMSVGQMILFGSTVVIRKKFSATAYFPDCVKYKATIAQYIGEMCRYCLSTPTQSADTSHRLRMVFGNGMRPQVWPQFVKRFKIPRVSEFYGATEGNANIVNFTNVEGAIGFVSRIIPVVYPISIIKADPDSGEPIRGKNGLCQKCRPNEPGNFIGKIIPNNPSRAFLGYVDKKASDKKIVRDVFKKGDAAFLSGDILSADEKGNLYFVDRTGDTFRWKGENCSTTEIEAQVSNESEYRDSVVYGVEIIGTDGKAGMAAIVDPEKTLNIKQLGYNLKKALPSYARPQFIRIVNEIEMTGTSKLKKLDLQKEGFNPNVVTDVLYYLNTMTSEYDLLTPEIYVKIMNREIRF